MSDGLDLIGVYSRIAKACRVAGSQAAWAAANGIPQSTLCEVLNGRREPTPAILRAIGLRKVVRYHETQGSKAA